MHSRIRPAFSVTCVHPHLWMIKKKDKSLPSIQWIKKKGQTETEREWWTHAINSDVTGLRSTFKREMLPLCSLTSWCLLAVVIYNFFFSTSGGWASSLRKGEVDSISNQHLVLPHTHDRVGAFSSSLSAANAPPSPPNYPSSLLSLKSHDDDAK